MRKALKVVVRVINFCAVALAAAACEHGATEPVDLNTLSLLIVNGDAQSGVVGAELTQPLVVKATTPNGGPIHDLTVNFVVTSGGGSVFAASVNTSPSGIAQDYWTLGTSASVPQTVEVRAVIPSSGDKRVFGTFSATPLPGPIALIAARAGDNQVAPNGSIAAISPAVRVSDEYDNSVPNVVVTFAVSAGGGNVTGAAQTTNAEGVAAVGSWTLGASPGADTLTASIPGTAIPGNPVTFGALATATGLGSWQLVNGDEAARAGMGSGVLNGLLFSVGGVQRGDFHTASDVFAFDPAADSWTRKASLPTPRTGLGVGVLNGLLYAVGGQAYLPDGTSRIVGTVEVYDPSTDTWTATTPLPIPRSGLAVGVVNNLLYAVGGSDGQQGLGTVEAYDPISHTWTTESPLPTPRSGLTVSVINGLLYAIGGGTSGAVEAYDPSSNKWTSEAPVPTPRPGLVSGAVFGLLYVAGGIGPHSNGGIGDAPTTDAYDPIANSWTAKAPMLRPMGESSGGVINGVLYVVGEGGGEAFRP